MARPPDQHPRVCALVVALLLGGCGDGTPPDVSSCPDDLPDSCPSPSPSYATQVAPILAGRCGSCHAPGKVQAAHSFETFEEVQSQAAGIRIQIDSCIMPPADQPQTTREERRTVLGWIVCGAMNN